MTEIRATHTASLPRSAGVTEMLTARERGDGARLAAHERSAAIGS
jgi:hypothetical protein